MKKVFFITIIFMIYNFISNTFYYSNKTKPVSIEIDNKESYYLLEFDNFKSTDFIKVFTDLDIQILEINIDKEIKFNYIPTSNNLNTIYNDLKEQYKNELFSNGYEEEAINYDIKGFNIDTIALLGTKADIEKIPYYKVNKH